MSDSPDELVPPDDAGQPDDPATEQEQPELGGILYRREYMSGPLPPPAVIREYDEIYTGAAKIIFERFESLSKHREEIERQTVRNEHVRQMAGVASGLMSLLAVIALAVFMVSQGQSGGAIGVVLTAMGAIVGVFVTGKLIEGKNGSAEAE